MTTSDTPRRWRRSDISTRQVLISVALFRVHAYEFFTAQVGIPGKVVVAAYRRESDRGLLDYGVSEAYPFLTEAGRVKLEQYAAEHSSDE